MNRLIIAFALAGVSLSAETPKVDYKLQFEARTLEMQAQKLQGAVDKKLAEFSGKVDEMRKACGASILSLDPQTAEYICLPAPKPEQKPEAKK